MHKEELSLPEASPPASGNMKMGSKEFIGFLAACMAMNALAIDIMLPALPRLGEEFSLQNLNAAQAVVAVYLLGMGVSQIFYGPLSDSYGRRPVLILGLSLFSVAGLLAAMTSDFSLLLIARFVQGLGGGAPRVIAISLARDRYTGAKLGRVMSLTMMAFMLAPILAPSLGQLILLVASWRWTFGALVLGGGLVAVWASINLGESLAATQRRALSLSSVLSAYRMIFSGAATVKYILACGLVFGGQMGFVISAQRIFTDIFQAQSQFGMLFAVIASAMAVASFTNSRLVMHFGMRRIALFALVLLVLLNGIHWLIAINMAEPIWVFLLLQMGSMAMFGFLGANLNALAIEPLGHVAGTGASAIGLVTTVLGAGLGFMIGQSFDGTVVPLTQATVVLAVVTLALVLSANSRNESRNIVADQAASDPLSHGSCG